MHRTSLSSPLFLPMTPDDTITIANALSTRLAPPSNQSLIDNFRPGTRRTVEDLSSRPRAILENMPPLKKSYSDNTRHQTNSTVSRTALSRQLEKEMLTL